MRCKLGRLFLSPPHMGKKERELLVDAFDSNWIAPLGPMVDSFEQHMIEYLASGEQSQMHALALSSGTSALHLALVESGICTGDRVLCSSLTFSASANAITYVGAEPVFVDVAQGQWNLDPDLVEQELALGMKQGKPYKAVIAVDLYGDPVDFEPIEKACKKYDAVLIEDAAEGLGADYKGRKCGTFGEYAILSFNGNKILTSGGGGMLLGHKKEKIDHARKLSTQAREPAPYYQHEEIGYNYRLSNLLAAVGLGQLEWLDDRVHRKHEIRSLYEKRLVEVPGLSFLPLPGFGKSNCWLTVVIVDKEVFGCDPESIRLALEDEDIESRPVWKPMHMQPVFSGCRFVGPGRCEELFYNGLCLPSGTAMEDDDVNRICELLISSAK